jgi:hypothetical protein
MASNLRRFQNLLHILNHTFTYLRLNSIESCVNYRLFPKGIYVYRKHKQKLSSIPKGLYVKTTA